MFIDANLRMLKVYEKTNFNSIIPTFDTEVLYSSSFIFIRKEHIKFFDKTIKYNILFDINNNFTVYIPSAICNGNYVDYYHNSIRNNFHILNDEIINTDIVSNCKSLNYKHNNKQHIIIDNSNFEIAKIANSMYEKLKSKDTYQKTIEEKRLEEEKRLHKNIEEEYLKIKNKLSRELNSVLKKYDVKAEYLCGEYGVIFKGNHVYDECFMDLFD